MIVFLIQVVCYRMIVEYAATVSGGTEMSDEFWEIGKLLLCSLMSLFNRWGLVLFSSIMD